MIQIDQQRTWSDFSPLVEQVFACGADKVRSIEQSSTLHGRTPVFTQSGVYVPQGWTEWTQGFQFGSAILCFDALDDVELLELGRRNTLERMTPHLTSFGVHDHGFNNVSTYGNLRRLILEARIPHDDSELQLYKTALKVSGAVQAFRWTETDDEEGFIFSFNGPHSLFCDTIRSLRSLALSYRLGHVLLDENDEPVCLLQRLLEHASMTARYNVYYGEDRDIYDVRGRVAHESIFNVNDGRYRCPSTQQGYSPFSTWTRGLAWIMLGYTEQIEFLNTLSEEDLDPHGGRDACLGMMLTAATATCDYYIDNTPINGIPYWDTGAPGLAQMGDYLSQPADPFNRFEPVDSSAAAIAAQGLLRLARILETTDRQASDLYHQAGLRVAASLMSEPYLNQSPDHQGILLHSVYHRPKGWDQVTNGSAVPHGESCMWGDYHLLELALYLKRQIEDGPYYTFWGS